MIADDPHLMREVWLFGVMPCALLAIGVVALLAWWIPYRRRQIRREDGRCPQCGYDLTGNVSGVCPACGTEVRDRGVRR